MLKLNDFISLSERKTVSGRFSIDWTKTFEGIKRQHRKQDCLDCNNGKFWSDCFIKARMKCFIKMSKACKSCLNLESQNKTYSTDINLLKRQPPNEKHQMLLWYVGQYTPKTYIFIFESAKDVLVSAEKQMLKVHVLRG